MIQLDVFFTLNELDLPLKKDSAVVIAIDILRAGTTVCKALGSGAKEIIPVCSSEEALNLYNKFDKSDILLCGERNGKKIDGYHLGNSPFEYEPNIVSGKTLILNTTNGSSLFKKLISYPHFYVGAFVNFSFLFEEVVNIFEQKQISLIILACAGQNNRFTFEDVLYCGCFIENLQKKLLGEKFKLNDGARASKELFSIFKNDLLNFVKTTDHSAELIRLNFEKDIDFSFTFDLIPVIPVSNGSNLIIKK
ncbi:MAG: 2-phosphosulfolactate phosphatase [Ignavibacteria bacterium]|nr:2-phosphosulfolactate phosphatase [Ignavibacteria bacterium]